MDGQLRELERAAETGGPVEHLAWATAMVRTGRAGALPDPRQKVFGARLTGALRHLFRGRRDADVLRQHQVNLRRRSKELRRLRALLEDHPLEWMFVERWAEWLGIDPACLSLLAERVVEPPRVVQPQPSPDERVCFNCTSMLWAVGIGQGILCTNTDSPVRYGGMIPSRWYTCDQFRSRHRATPAPANTGGTSPCP